MTDIKGYFKIIALKKLNERDRTGYDLIKSMESVFDKKPSAGSIYPMLNEFLEKELVTVNQHGRRKIYSITSKGRKKINNLLKEKEHLMMKTLELLRLFGEFTGEKKVKSLNELIGQMKSNEELILRNIDVWTDLKDVMIKIAVGEDYKTKQKEVRKILKDATRKLRELHKSR